MSKIITNHEYMYMWLGEKKRRYSRRWSQLITGIRELYRCTNQRCRSPVNNISTRSLIPATRVYRAKSVPFHEARTFLRSARSVIHCAYTCASTSPRDCVRADDEAKLGLVGVGAKNFLICLQITESNYNVPRRDASTCLFSSVFPASDCVSKRVSAGWRWRDFFFLPFFLSRLIRLGCTRKDTCLCGNGVCRGIYRAEFIVE